MLFGFSFIVFCKSCRWAHSSQTWGYACSSHLCDCYWWNIVWIHWYVRLLPRNKMVWTNAVAISGNPWLSIFTSLINESQPTMSTLWLFRYSIKTLVNSFALAVMTTNNCTSCWHCLPILRFPQYTDKFHITWKLSILGNIFKPDACLASWYCFVTHEGSVTNEISSMVPWNLFLKFEIQLWNVKFDEIYFEMWNLKYDLMPYQLITIRANG